MIKDVHYSVLLDRRLGPLVSQGDYQALSGLLDGLSHAQFRVCRNCCLCPKTLPAPEGEAHQRNKKSMEFFHICFHVIILLFVFLICNYCKGKHYLINGNRKGTIISLVFRV